ncbi:MAG: acyl carrier protein [Lachnospiraceae bacterium]|nr:acyl carrier protein [Lachnospiraceae bacterium]
MLDELKEIICNYVDVNPEDVNEDSRFVEDLGFTSYDFMSMVGELEEQYDIEVEEREVVRIMTVGDAIQYLEKLIG